MDTSIRSHSLFRNSPLTRFLLSSVCLLWLEVPLALADRPRAPTSYTALSENKEFEFVMNVPGAANRGKRPSGLYRRHSANPLWTVSWYADSVTVSSDGKHLIRWGAWASALENEAFSFFANGKLVREYRIKDLVTTAEGLQYTVSHFFWLHRMHFDDANHLLSVTTLTGDEHQLSTTSGKFIRSGKTAERMLQAEVCEFRVRSATDSTFCQPLFPKKHAR